MKKKVIGYFILFVVFVLGLFTNSLATTFNMTECNSKWTTESIATELIKYFSPNYTNDSKALQWINSIKDYDYTCFGVDWGTYTHRMYCWILQESGYFNGSVNSNNFRTYYNANNLSWIIDFSTSSNKPTNVFSATDTNFKNQGMNFDSVYQVCNANNKFYEGGSSGFKLSNLTPPVLLDFSPYNDGFITVYNNGSGESFLKYKLSRSVNSWALGKLDGLDDSMRVDARLSFFIPGTQNYTSSIGHAQSYYGQTSSSGGLSITSDGVVYINNSNIYYEQGYNLSVDLEGETLGNFYLYFLPYGSNKVSGDLYSPDLDSNEYLDIVQNLQELISIVNVNNIYDENFSGDSGDVLLGTLDYNEYNNDYNDYLSTTFMALRNSLLGSGDVAFSFNFMGNNMTVNSNQFYVPDGVLKFFVTSFLVFATIYYLYVQVSHFFHKLQEGDLESALETYSINDESVLM